MSHQSTGGNLAETLARMGFTRLIVIDRDRVELRNLSSQPYAMGEVGAPKARALAGGLYRAVQARVEARNLELTEVNAVALLAGSALVVDAFDNYVARATVTGAVRTLVLPCLPIGFSGDGLYGSVRWDRGYQVPRPSVGDPCDYPLTRPLALCLVALAARSIAEYVHAGAQQSYELTWADPRIVVAPLDTILSLLTREAPAVVVNTIGPFTDIAPRAVRACPPGTHYVDVANELAAVSDKLDLHEQAVATGRTLVTGAGFGVLATESVVLQLCAGRPPAARVRVDALASVVIEPGVIGSALAATIIDGVATGFRRVERGRIVRSWLARDLERLTTPDGVTLSSTSVGWTMPAGLWS